MSPATPAGRCRIPAATVLALFAWGALAGIQGHSAPPAGGAAAGPPPVDPLIATVPAGQAASVASVLGQAVDTNDP
jgi:hypothetical protein